MLETSLAPPTAAPPLARPTPVSGDKTLRHAQSSPPPLVEPWWKRPLDCAVASVLLVASAPFLLFSMLLVKLTSPGPTIYSQTRLGKNGRPFTIYKVRSMTYNCERQSGARWSTPGDVRVTPVGKLLRVSHLDELPQLWNVLRGDMSLVGPRPERPEFVPQLERQIPHYRERLRVLPGLTGLAQVNLPPDTDIGSVVRKLKYDIYYVQNLYLWLDVRLIGVTAIHVAGVPFRWLCKLACLPGRQEIETYR